MAAYYNEIDPYAAQWLRNMVLEGLIPYGVVDDRSIKDVEPREIAEFTQCHFFAGIGVWPLALRRAGWADDRRIWTGSCPCQPFSEGGKKEGFDDERHLWPDWFWNIGELKPDVVLGEQVSSKDGRVWLDLVCADMEGAGYALGSVVTNAAGFGSHNLRERTYFAGVANADPSGQKRQVGSRKTGEEGEPDRHAFERLCADVNDRFRDREKWHEGYFLSGEDRNHRPIEPGTFPLVDGYPGRVDQLCAYGNALNLGQATAFVESVMEFLD